MLGPSRSKTVVAKHISRGTTRSSAGSRPAAAFALVMAFAPAASAVAQEPGRAPQPLGEIVVSADHPVSEAAAATRRVTAEDIAAVGARTLDEALALLPGVYVRTGADGVPRVDMRGLRTRQVTLLLDGVPFNATSDGQFDPSFIPVEQIQEIKVTGGTGSVLYGSGGLAGTINIVTRGGAGRPAGALRGEWRDGNAWLGSAMVAGASGAVDGYVGADIATTDRVPSFGASPTLGSVSDATRFNSGRDRRNVFGRVGVRRGRFESALSWQSTSGNYGIPPSVIDDPADPFANRPVFERVEQNDGLATQLAGSWTAEAGSVRGWLYRNLANQLTERYANATFDPASVLSAAGTSRERSRSLRSGGAVQAHTARLPAGRLTLELSADRSTWQQLLNQATSSGSGGGGGGHGGGGGGGSSTVTVQTSAVDRTLQEYGVALEYEVRPLRRLGVVGGAMYHWLTGEGRADDAAGSSLGAAFDLTSRATLRASFAHRFRFPALRQLFDADGGNTALTTEWADVFEAGVNYRVSSALAFDVTGFHSQAHGFIERSATTDLFENNDRYRIRGLEFETTVRPAARLFARARYTYLDAVDRSPGSEGLRLQYRPMHTVVGEFRYAAAHGWMASSSLRYVAGQVYETRQAPLLQADLPNFVVVGARMEHPVGGLPLSAYAGVDNLFDAAYEQAYGFPQSGRIVYVGIAVPNLR